MWGAGLPQEGETYFNNFYLILITLVSRLIADNCEFRKHFLKIVWKSVDNYYLLAFTENIKYSPKKWLFFLFSETNRNIEKLRLIPMNFLYGSGNKNCSGSKMKFIKEKENQSLAKQYSWQPPPVRKKDHQRVHFLKFSFFKAVGVKVRRSQKAVDQKICFHFLTFNARRRR